LLCWLGPCITNARYSEEQQPLENFFRAKGIKTKNEMADGDSDGGGDDAPEEELAERPKKKLKTAK
jgi:hypothetical protein